MNIFSKLKDLIFNRHQPSFTPGSGAATTGVPSGGPAASPSIATATEKVDIGAVLDELAAKNPEKLDWKRSIVDLMKLVGMDSSFSNRKELAQELGYDGSTSDSAAMNVWLHQAVMKKLAENGGKVPAELLD